MPVRKQGKKLARGVAPRQAAQQAAAGGERALIRHIQALAGAVEGEGARMNRALQLGIGDDCAILRAPRGHDLLVTTDFSLEGRHFRRDWHTARAIGHRTLARGLSDLAAMGATPLSAFLSLALPRSVARDRAWIDGFFAGLLELARTYKVPLAGGDTAESPDASGPVRPGGRAERRQEGPVLADIVLLGSAPAGQALRRSGARPGDRICCTGSLGGAAAELAQLAQSPRRYRQAAPSGGHPHLFPQPRLRVGRALLNRRLASACIDLSDGLSTDLPHICDRSSEAAGEPIGAEIDAAALPVHPIARALRPETALQQALHGGEDYELLFTVPAGRKLPRSLSGVPVSEIGRVVRRAPRAPQVTLILPPSPTPGRNANREQRVPLLSQGWEHLR